MSSASNLSHPALDVIKTIDEGSGGGSSGFGGDADLRISVKLKTDPMMTEQ